MLLAPLGLKGNSPCSQITPNRGSVVPRGFGSLLFGIDDLTNKETLLGGLCTVLPSTFYPMLPAPFDFWHSLLFTNFHCSIFISLCSLLPFNFSSCSMIISLPPCSIPLFLAAPYSILPFLCSLLLD